jgi:glycosyltransferase involved in cell wall biosynthesis
MKICLVHLTFGEDVFGGVENSMFNLAIGLLNLGHKVIVYTSRTYAKRINKSEIKIYNSKYLKNKFLPISKDIDLEILDSYNYNKSYIEDEISEIIRIEKLDYILAVDHLWGIIPYIEIWNLGCKIGLLFHMYYKPELIKRALLLPFDHFFGVSNFLIKNIYQDFNSFIKKTIHLLPNSINFKMFQLTNTVQNNQVEDFIFCNARMATGKGIEILLNAFEKVIQERPNINLLLCGGAYHFGDRNVTLKKIKKIIKKNQQLKTRLTILPLLKWSEIPNYLFLSKLVVLPTQFESFGIAALEAMASGIPLITTSTGNLPDLVQDAGILVNYGDIDGLYKAIMKIFSDQQLSLLLSKKGQNIAINYDNAIVADRFIYLITSNKI